MKISPREMILISLLFLIAWVYVSVSYIVSPATERVAAAQERLADVQFREQTARHMIAALPDLAAREEEQYERAIGEAEVYFPGFSEESLVAFIHNLARSSGLNVSVITADGLYLRNLDQLIAESGKAEQDYLTGQLAMALTESGSEETEEAAEPDASAKGKSDILTNAAYAYVMQIDFNAANYVQISAFLKGFENLGRLSAINNLAINTGDQGALSGSFTINLMVVDSISNREPAFETVRPTTVAGKTDPFR